MRPSLTDRLRASWRILAKEISAFGVVGLINLVIEVGLLNVLHYHVGLGLLTSKAIAATVATLIAYFANRHWSFSHRARTGLARETSYFFTINFAWLAVTEAILALFKYGLSIDDKLAINIVNFATIGVGTIFRFWAYKRFVFLAHDTPSALGTVDEIVDDTVDSPVDKTVDIAD
jgi:putative flippase GtrA